MKFEIRHSTLSLSLSLALSLSLRSLPPSPSLPPSLSLPLPRSLRHPLPPSLSPSLSLLLFLTCSTTIVAKSLYISLISDIDLTTDCISLSLCSISSVLSSNWDIWLDEKPERGRREGGGEGRGEGGGERVREGGERGRGRGRREKTSMCMNLLSRFYFLTPMARKVNLAIFEKEQNLQKRKDHAHQNWLACISY